MNRGTFAKSVVPGLFSFAVETFKERPELWRSLCTVKNSRKAYEESAFYAGFGYIPKKPEGTSITYDELIQGPNMLFSLLRRKFEVIKKAISGKALLQLG